MVNSSCRQLHENAHDIDAKNKKWRICTQAEHLIFNTANFSTCHIYYLFKILPTACQLVTELSVSFLSVSYRLSKSSPKMMRNFIDKHHYYFKINKNLIPIKVAGFIHAFGGGAIHSFLTIQARSAGHDSNANRPDLGNPTGCGSTGTPII